LHSIIQCVYYHNHHHSTPSEPTRGARVSCRKFDWAQRRIDAGGY
jgi:hypothetical protein